MLLFLPDSICSSTHCVVDMPRSGECLANVGRRKCSHLRAVADARSPGLCSTVAVKPWGPCFFSRSPRIKHLAQDCQNPSCHGGKSRLRGCAAVYWWERETKKAVCFDLKYQCFPLSRFSCLACVATCLWMCPTYWPYEEHSVLREACYRTTYFMSLHAYSSWKSVSCVAMFSWNQSAKTWKCGDKAWKHGIVSQERTNSKQHGLRHWAVSRKD